MMKRWYGDELHGQYYDTDHEEEIEAERGGESMIDIIDEQNTIEYQITQMKKEHALIL